MRATAAQRLLDGVRRRQRVAAAGPRGPGQLGVEVDVVGKYVERMLGERAAGTQQ